MITLLNPYWLFILPLPLAVYFMAPAFKVSERAIRVPFFARLLRVTGKKAHQASRVMQPIRMQKIALVVTWAILVLCLAQPAIIGKSFEIQKTARDLMVAVDLSKSMNTADFPSENASKIKRWDALESLLTRFSAQRKGDRLGLIAFGSGAYVQVPFTADIATWQLMLTGLTTDIAGPATAIGDAIGLSLRTFDKSTSKQKVLLLVTDGADTASSLPPIEAAKVAKAKGVQIYTIAIGDPKTQAKDERVDIKTLQLVSSLTGGHSFIAASKGALEQVLDEVNQIAPSQFSSQTYQPTTLLYPHLLIGLVSFYFCMWTVLSVLEVKQRRHRHV
ncbi:VWA domain-containing protein [Shewanella kaireitica]|uniref:VWA domain-containing protein n=1 Tax=Shewanella kaireitica TaxID=212021 RepID=UPI00200D1004|nr:VWA domain-containing protein [Shewanella kaireitica]MCL1094321.1 VWA domain-containing protein [Shewanella kaireitica]